MLTKLIETITELLYHSSNIPEAERFAAMRHIYTAQTGDELADAVAELPYSAQLELAEQLTE